MSTSPVTSHPPPDLIEVVRQAVESTGFPFELSIARRIEGKGYFVTPSHNFEDVDTGQSRELDLHAISGEFVSRRRRELVWTVLLGSCKANSCPYVFFTRDNLLQFAPFVIDYPVSGAPMSIFTKKGDRLHAARFFRLAEFHHAMRTPRIASQFCELVPQGSGARAPLKPNTAVLDSVVVPLIKAMSQEIEQHCLDAFPTPEDDTSNYQLYYPLIVLRGPMFECYVPPAGELSIMPTNHVVVVRHYASRVLTGEYAIDAVHESYLEQFLDTVQEETRVFARRIRAHGAQIAESMRRLAEEEVAEKHPALV